MDEMKISSAFTTSIISKLVNRVIRKKLGYDIGLKLNGVKANVSDGKIYVHLDADAELEQKDLIKLLSL